MLLQMLDLDTNTIAIKLGKNLETIVAKLKNMRSQGLIKRDYIIKFVQDTSNFSLEISKWTNLEIEIFINNVSNMGLIKLSKLLNKSTFDVIMMFYCQKEIIPNIKTYWNCKDYSDWSKEEDLYIAKHFSNSLREHILSNLPDKTWKQITRRAKIFGLQRNNFGTKYISSNEKILQKLLDELNITYIFQKRIDYNKNKFYIADFLLNSSNIILEAQGDYWHGNPKVFPVPSNTQLLKIANDAKRKSILEDLGYKVIYIWEYDLIHNYQQCKDIIKALLPV